MINGQGSPNGGKKYEKFDPTGDLEVTDILPTATGQYLEEMRKASQRNPVDVTNETRTKLYVYVYFIFFDEEKDEAVDENMAESAYRHAPRSPMHPHDGWFEKPKNGKPQMVCVRTSPQKKA